VHSELSFTCDFHCVSSFYWSVSCDLIISYQDPIVPLFVECFMVAMINFRSTSNDCCFVHVHCSVVFAALLSTELLTT
jgi:hypothetical protein